jgi:hypothetical protein
VALLVHHQIDAIGYGERHVASPEGRSLWQSVLILPFPKERKTGSRVKAVSRPVHCWCSASIFWAYKCVYVLPSPVSVLVIVSAPV